MATVDSLKMDKTAFSVASLSDESDEKEYWLSKTPYERLEAVEIMRQIIYGYDPSSPDFKDFLQLLNSHAAGSKTWPTWRICPKVWPHPIFTQE